MNSVEGSLASEAMAALRPLEGGAIWQEIDTRTSSPVRYNLRWGQVCIDSIQGLRNDCLNALKNIPSASQFQQRETLHSNAMSLFVGLQKDNQRIFIEIDSIADRLHVSILDCTIGKD